MIKTVEQTKPTQMDKKVEPAPVPMAPATNMKNAEPAKPSQMDKKVVPAPIPTTIPRSQLTQPTTTAPKPASQPTKKPDEKKMVGKEFGKPGENYIEFARINEKK
uniref:Uncharacterized protein n=1 Tax=Panagrolaimus sp. PS1159 TaxID=55785 RepID=A0AC35G6W2_9BILA